MSYFANLGQPVMESVLKSEFRRLAKKLHSDVGGSDAEFRALKAEYDSILTNGCVIAAVVDVSETIDGRRLSELGLGLKVNGRPCENCQSTGYHKVYRHEALCERCSGTTQVYYCSGCQRVLDGRWPMACCRGARVKWITCPDCYRGYVKRGVAYVTCSACQGHGETPVFNPVIIKGTMSA